jgi:hypothetical protein
MFARGFAASLGANYDGRRSAFTHFWRRWGWLTLWIVPAILTLELIGLLGCWLAPRSSLAEAVALVVVFVPLGIAALCAGIATLAALAMLVAGPWRWARDRTLDWYSR